MRRIILFITVLTIVISIQAQQGLGIQAGVNFSNFAGKDAKEFDMKTGFQAGINYNIPLGNDFFVQPGLNYIQNGTKVNGNLVLVDTLAGADVKIHLNYLQIPVLFQYQPTVGTGKLLLGAGPYIAMGIGDVKGAVGDLSEKGSWDDAGIKKLDAGAKAVIGYQHASGVSLHVNADFGLLKNLDSDFYGTAPKVRNGAFGITLGYRF